MLSRTLPILAFLSLTACALLGALPRRCPRSTRHPQGISRTTLPASLALPAAAGEGLRRRCSTRTCTRARALIGTPRWALAASDANLMFPAAAGPSPARSTRASTKPSPHLYL
jgi:hypothetical protein